MSDTLRVLVVDDEPLARRRLLRMLGRIPGVEVVGEAGDGDQALRQIRELAPDAVLLDIRMPGLDGLTLATQTPGLPPVIFTTAYDEYAVRAFEAAAVDYLLKPIEGPRLEQALDRVRRRKPLDDPGKLATLLSSLLSSRAPMESPRITARLGSALRVFDARAITRFHAADKCTLFKHGGKEYVLDDSLDALEQRLAPAGFLRVHRAELINLEHVTALRAYDGGWIVELTDDQTAPVSRRHAPALKQRLGIV